MARVRGVQPCVRQCTVSAEGGGAALQRFLLARSAPLIGPLAARLNSASRRVPPVDVRSNRTATCCPVGGGDSYSYTICDSRRPPSACGAAVIGSGTHSSVAGAFGVDG